MPNYKALAAIWASLPESDIWQKLEILNALFVDDVLWPQANGWQGPLNQNDLVPAGIITDEERIAAELNEKLITKKFADQLLDGDNGAS